jgi:hypothetical protein
MKVSCICPTVNRPHLLKRCIEGFLLQDYSDKQLIIVCDKQEDIIAFSEITDLVQKHGIVNYDIRFIVEPGKIGYKRNICCENAEGDIVLHMDDDDFYGPRWISGSVKHLLATGADCTGMKTGYFYRPSSSQLWLYNYKDQQPFVLGATLCYTKELWKRNAFQDKVSKRSGKLLPEDGQFCANAGKIVPHAMIADFCVIRHGSNTQSDHILYNDYFTPVTNNPIVLFGDKFKAYVQG